MRKISMIILTLCFVGMSNVYSQSTLLQVTADSLNVRDNPNGKVIDKLSKYSIVGLVSLQNTWANIIYLGKDKKIMKKGWVSVAYVKFLKNSSGHSVTGDDCQTEYDTDSEVCVSVDNVKLKCSESLMSNSYDRCYVDIDYSLSTNYEGDDSLDVTVECEAEVKYETRDGFMTQSKRQDDTYSHNLYSSGSDYGDMRLNINVSSLLDETIKVKLYSAECRIDSVYNY